MHRARSTLARSQKFGGLERLLARTLWAVPAKGSPYRAERFTGGSQNEVDRGDLVPIPPELITEGLPLNLVWPIGRQLLPKVDAVLELLSSDLRIS